VDYSCSVWRCRHKIAGKWLDPLTLGHCLVLQRHGSPFVPTHRPRHQPNPRSGESDILHGDILLAVYVCSRGWREAKRGLERWSGRIAGFRLRCWAQWRVGFREHDIVAFSEWWRAQWDKPGIVIDDKKTGFRGATAVPILISTERLHYGKTFEQALDTLVGEAFWDHALFHEDEGECRITAETDDRSAERAAEFEQRCTAVGVSVPSTFDRSKGAEAAVIAELRKGLN
jgi:hypothetical protein